ncbi:MAG: integrin alpha, partial [Pseudomonadota bacterium]
AGAGRAVAIAGDLNGDGLADLVTSSEPLSFVLPGRNTPFPAVIPASDIGANQGLGVRIASQPTGPIESLGGGGDVNGDGIDDLILGAPEEEFAGDEENGGAYVVFGTTALDEDVALATLDGDDGFVVRYPFPAFDSRIGEDVDIVGDINGDNIDDLVLGAPYDGLFLYSRGYGHAVFGSDEGFPPQVDLFTNAGDDTFYIVSNDYLTGQGVSALGDVNGDGIDDFAIGTSRGNGYVVFGKGGPFGEFFATFDGVEGFIIEPNGDFPDDISLDRAGDVNGDGLDDIILSARIDGFTGAAYVLYGRPTFDATVDLSNLSPGAGVALVSPPACCASLKATPVAGDFDINADGFADLLIAGARTIPGAGELVEAYVVYGGNALPAQVNLAALDGSDGFTLRTPPAQALTSVDVDGGGDLNGDGLDDLVLGTVLDFGGAQVARRSFVIFGRSPAK